MRWMSSSEKVSHSGNSASLHDLHTFRLKCEHFDLQVANANQTLRRVATLGENQQGPMTKNKNDHRMMVVRGRVSAEPGYSPVANIPRLAAG